MYINYIWLSFKHIEIWKIKKLRNLKFVIEKIV